MDWASQLGTTRRRVGEDFINAVSRKWLRTPLPFRHHEQPIRAHVGWPLGLHIPEHWVQLRRTSAVAGCTPARWLRSRWQSVRRARPADVAGSADGCARRSGHSLRAIGFR